MAKAFKHCVRHVCRWGELEDAMGLVYGTAVQLDPSQAQLEELLNAVS